MDAQSQTVPGEHHGAPGRRQPDPGRYIGSGQGPPRVSEKAYASPVRFVPMEWVKLCGIVLGAVATAVIPVVMYITTIKADVARHEKEIERLDRVQTASQQSQDARMDKLIETLMDVRAGVAELKGVLQQRPTGSQ